MPSKWAALKSSLPAFENEQSWQQRINLWKSTYVGENPEHANVAALAALMADYKKQKDSLEERIKELNVPIEALSQMLVERLEGEATESVSLSSGATCYLNYEPYPSVEDKGAMIAWLKEQGMEALLSLNYQTLRGLVGELLQDGKPLPPGVKAYLKITARLRNGRG